MDVKNLKTGNLRNDEHFQFGAEFRKLVNEFTPEALKITTLFNKWLALYDDEDVALKKIVKSILTDKIQDADKVRDDLFRGMVDANKSALKHFDADVRDAAERLQTVFNTYGNVAVKPLNEETSAIYNLVQDLKSSRYAAAVTKVGLNLWLLKLEESNIAYDNLTKERYDEKATITTVVLKEARTEIDDVYRNIVKHIEARLLLEDDKTVFEQFILKLNLVVDKFNNTLKQRQGMAAAKNLPPSPPPQEGGDGSRTGRDVADDGDDDNMETGAKAEVVSIIASKPSPK